MPHSAAVPPAAPRAALFALGCRLNQAEIGLLADQLRQAGFRIVAWEEPAELLVINSCTVTAAAAAKTRNLVRRTRRRFPEACIVLTGCDATVAAEQWAADGAPDLVVANPEKHAWLDRLPARLRPPAAESQNSGAAAAAAREPGFRFPGVAGGREKTRANLKIQEGCDVHCSYCIIPAARGRPRSREFADTLREVRTLLERGAREIVLTGINTGLYDSGGKRLPELLAALAALPGEFRLRVSSLEPGPILPAVVAVMAAHPARICPHLHLPLQAADDRILRLMRRPYTFAEYAQQVAAAIRRLPGLCLGSDLIAGFPGETAELFAAGLEKLRQLPLAYLHVFSFSPRPGTLAATLPGQIPAGECRERVRTLEAQGERFAQSYVASRLGQTVQVLTESRDGAGRWRGTSEQFLEVTVLDAPADTAANRFLPVRLERALGGRAAGGRYAGG